MPYLKLRASKVIKNLKRAKSEKNIQKWLIFTEENLDVVEREKVMIFVDTMKLNSFLK
jgi:hypothetical protein